MFALYGNETLNHTARWHAEPNYRGTYTILSTSVVTIGLCVWQAVHLNIPGPDDKIKWYYRPSKQFWRKMGWLMIGVLAPELVCPFSHPLALFR
jgi:hypothetical protein